MRARSKRANKSFSPFQSLSLIDQTVDNFEREGIHSVGVVQGDHWRTDASQPVQICSVQTLARRRIPEAQLALIDEAHMMFKTVHDWMAEPEWADVPFIGLSATPWAKGLGRHYDDLIIAARTSELIDAGFLSPFTVFAPSTPNLSSVHTVAGEFHQGELADACNKTELVGDVIETWKQRSEDRPTLCYGVDRAHAEHLQQRFLEAGIAAEYIDCFTDRAERAQIFERFTVGRTRIICNVGTLTTGIDLDVRCIIDAKPTKSEILFVQTIGRGLRTAPGKDKLVVLDHAGNALRLGLVSDIHHDHLDMGEPRRAAGEREERSEPLPRLCDECKAVMPRAATICPSCGAVREAKSGVQMVDGELVELGSAAAPSLAPHLEDMAKFYGELKYISNERNYKPGWASYKFKERFGYWPNADRLAYVMATPPTLKTKQWVRSRQIAFAKGRHARG